MQAAAQQIIETAMRLTDLPAIVQTLQDRYADETRRREEFFHDITEDMKAEFINGEVIVHSPAKFQHSMVVAKLLSLLMCYVQRHRLGTVLSEKVFCSFRRNDYEPDIVFFGKEKTAAFFPHLMKYPPPDFVVEVLSPSTARNDRGVKFTDYESHGVGEYWIIDPETQTIEQYVLEAGKYVQRVNAATGEITSTVITGLTIPIRACFDEDVNIQALRQLLAAEET